VLADRRARVDRAYAEEFPQIGRARQTRLTGSGYAAGDQAGARADLAAARWPLPGRPSMADHPQARPCL
jgi:hypothetical protein